MKRRWWLLPWLAGLTTFYVAVAAANLNSYRPISGDDGWILSASYKLATEGTFGSGLYAIKQPCPPLDSGAPAEVQGAHALAADRIPANVQLAAEGDGLLAVDDLLQRLFVRIAVRCVEETGADRAVGLDHRRDPGRVALHRRERPVTV